MVLGVTGMDILLIRQPNTSFGVSVLVAVKLLAANYGILTFACPSHHHYVNVFKTSNLVETMARAITKASVRQI